MPISLLSSFLKVGGFNSTDYTVIAIFLLVLVAVPLVIGIRKRRMGLLALTFAGHDSGFLVMAFVMCLTEYGLSQVTGLAGWSVHHGLGVYAYSLMGAIGSIALGWFFMPVYIASGSLTTIDYASKRFGGRRMEIATVVMMLLINVINKVALQLHAAQMVMTRLYTDWPVALNHAALLLGAIFLVSIGGLFSVVYTSIWQFLFFAMGIPVVFYFSYQPFGSWDEITARYQRAWPESTVMQLTNGTSYENTKCGISDVVSMNIVRAYDDRVLPWPGMLFGIFIISIYKFCIDQSMVQFCLSGRNIVQVKYACLVNGFLECMSFLLVVPGFVARILFTDSVACADPDRCEKLCNRRAGCYDLALSMILKELIPAGWRGLVLTAFLAASFTSVAASLHAGSTIFTFNVYRLFRPHAREMELTIAGKLAIVGQTILGLALVMLSHLIPLIHEFNRRVYSCLVPPLVAVYSIGIFWSNVDEQIAFGTLVLGSVISLTRLVWETAYGTVPCSEGKSFPIPDIINNYHDLHFAVFLFVVCSSFIIIAGLTSKPVSQKHLYRLIFWLRHSRKERIDINRTHRRSRFGTAMSSSLHRPSIKTHHVMKASSMSDDDVDHYDDEVDPYEEVENEEEEEEEEWEDEMEEEEALSEWSHEFTKPVKNTRTGFLRNCGVCSNRQITARCLRAAMKENISLVELPRQSHALNMLLVLLLLVIVYIMGFFG